MRVRDLMSWPAVAVGPETHLKEVAEILRSRQISSVPIVDAERRLLGLVSEADLLPLEAIIDQRRQATPEQLPASAPTRAAEVMTREVISVEADADAGEVARLMSERRLRHVPVTEDGRLAGMLSRRDLIGMLARPDSELQAEVQQLLDSELGHQTPRVEVHDGRLLIGLAADAPAYRLVEVLATSVPGIVAVTSAPVNPVRR